jgi:hypothetical protein
MQLGQSHITVGLVTIFIAVFMLFYVFDSIDKIVKNCQSTAEMKICLECCRLGSFGVSVLVVLLIVGGLTLVVCVTAYILLTA